MTTLLHEKPSTDTTARSPDHPVEKAFSDGLLLGMRCDRVSTLNDGRIGAMRQRGGLVFPTLPEDKTSERSAFKYGLLESGVPHVDSLDLIHATRSKSRRPVSCIAADASGAVRVFRSAWWRTIDASLGDPQSPTIPWVIHHVTSDAEGLLFDLIDSTMVSVGSTWVSASQARPNAVTIRRIADCEIDLADPVVSIMGQTLTHQDCCRATLKRSFLGEAFESAGLVVRQTHRVWSVPRLGEVCFTRQLDVTDVHVGLSMLSAAVARLSAADPAGAWDNENVRRALKVVGVLDMTRDSRALMLSQMEEDLAPSGSQRLPFILRCSVHALRQVTQVLSSIQG